MDDIYPVGQVKQFEGITGPIQDAPEPIVMLVPSWLGHRFRRTQCHTS